MKTQDLVNKLVADVQALSAKLEAVDAKGTQSQNMAQKTLGVMMQLDDINQLQNQKIMALEQTVASNLKLLQALVESLSEQSLVSTADIMTRVRRSEESRSKEQVESMLKSGFIENAELAELGNLVVVAQTVRQGDEAPRQLAEYRVYDLSVEKPDPSIESLIGKKVGESGTYSEGDLTIESVLVASYKAKERTVTNGAEQTA